jgi:flagellar basal-body rod modification protein FlgD
MDIANVAASRAGATATMGVGLDGLRGEDFMKILITQLQYQDPFEPMGNQEMVAQIASIRDLEMNTQLTGSLRLMTEQQRVGSAAALIGKYAKGEVSDAEGNVFTIEGIVTGIRFTQKGEAMLELDTGELLPLASLTEVRKVGMEM